MLPLYHLKAMVTTLFLLPIASTEPWHDAIRKRKCPRRRPGRRTRRREKEAEDHESGRRACVDFEIEREVDMGRFPLEVLPALAETLEDLEADWLEFKEGQVGSSVDSAPTQCTPMQPQLWCSTHQSLKRKFEAVESVVMERDCDKEAARGVSNDLEKMSQIKPASFYMQVKIVLFGLVSTLDGPRPNDKNEVVALQTLVRKSFIDAVVLSQAAAYTAEAREVLEIILSHITENVDTYSSAPVPGMTEWCVRLDSEFESFESLDFEDKELFLDDVKAEMEEHKSQIGFCLELIAEVISPEE